MTEVILIVFLVAIGTIGVAGLFGDNIRGLFGASAESVAGAPDVANPGQQAQKVKWDMKGGSLSAYGAEGADFNPGGTSANGGNGIRPAFMPPTDYL